jgi:hypothetical protein
MVFRRKGTPSLTRSVARTAIVANVAGRQMAKGAAAAAAKNAPPPAADAPMADTPAAAAPVTGGMTPEKLGMLKDLADLRSQGILSDAEFEAEKAKLLHG